MLRSSMFEERFQESLKKPFFVKTSALVLVHVQKDILFTNDRILCFLRLFNSRFFEKQPA